MEHEINCSSVIMLRWSASQTNQRQPSVWPRPLQVSSDREVTWSGLLLLTGSHRNQNLRRERVSLSTVTMVTRLSPWLRGVASTRKTNVVTWPYRSDQLYRKFPLELKHLENKPAAAEPNTPHQNRAGSERPAGVKKHVTLTFVEQVEGGGGQVGEHRRHLLGQVDEAAGDLLVHREPADLLHLLVLPQQVGLHRHRHHDQNRTEPTEWERERETDWAETRTDLIQTQQSLWRSWKSAAFLSLLPPTSPRAPIGRLGVPPWPMRVRLRGTFHGAAWPSVRSPRKPQKWWIIM